MTKIIIIEVGQKNCSKNFRAFFKRAWPVWLIYYTAECKAKKVKQNVIW